MKSMILKEDVEKQVSEIGTEKEEFDKFEKEKEWDNYVNATQFELLGTITAKRESKTRESIKIEKLEKGKYYTKEVLKYCGWNTKELFDKKLIKIILEEKPEGVIELKDIKKEGEEEKIKKVEKEKLKEEVNSKLLMKKTREATELITKYIRKIKYIHTTRDDDKSEMWIYDDGIYIPNGRTYIKQISREILGSGYTNHMAKEVIAKIETETYIEQDKFFVVEDINKIAVKNGIIDLKTKTIHPFTPKEKHFNKLPIIFDKNIDCPYIKQHLKNVLQNEKDLPVIQELFGYLLYREYEIEKAFMFTGSGRNGKGKTLELMKRFLGIENCANITLQHLDTDPFAMGELFNKLANLGGDISCRAMKETGAFKNLTGRDLVSAARKFKTRVNFTNYAKMIFAANELPITYDITTAFFNRWILLEFPYTFFSQKEIDCLEEKDKINIKLADTNIIDKISTDKELSGLLNWAMEGLIRLLKQSDFSYSPSTNEVKTKWIRKSDSAMAFLLDNIKEEYGKYIKKGELRYKYNQYCKLHKIKPSGDKHLKNTLEINFGVTDARHSLDGEVTHCWEGIEFKKMAVKEELINEK